MARGRIHEGQSKRNVIREFHGSHPHNDPDDTISRGEGIFREDGGAVQDFADGGEVEREYGGKVKRKKGGRIAKAFGGTIGGGAKKPSMGRAARQRGGGVGADLSPQTHYGGNKVKGRHIMSEGDKEPPSNC